MNECERFEEMISALLDGELSAGEEAEVRAHMEHCPECRAMYEAFAAVGEAIGTQEVPATLHSGIMEKVHAADKASRTQHTIVRLRPILAAAACLIVVVGTVFALKNTVGFGRSTKLASAAEIPHADEARPEIAMAPDTGTMYVTGGASGASAKSAAPVPEAAAPETIIFDSKMETKEESYDQGVNSALMAPEAPKEAVTEGGAAEAREEPKQPDAAKGTAVFTMRLETRTDAGLTGTVTDAGDRSVVSENAQITVLWDGDSSAWEIGTLLEVIVDAHSRPEDDGGIRAVGVAPAEVAPVQ